MRVWHHRKYSSTWLTDEARQSPQSRPGGAGLRQARMSMTALKPGNRPPKKGRREPVPMSVGPCDCGGRLPLSAAKQWPSNHHAACSHMVESPHRRDISSAHPDVSVSRETKRAEADEARLKRLSNLKSRRADALPFLPRPVGMSWRSLYSLAIKAIQTRYAWPAAPLTRRRAPLHRRPSGLSWWP